MSSGLSDLFGAESEKFSGKFESARRASTKKIIDAAINAKANALIGVGYNYITIAANMVVVAATGTAVEIVPIEGPAI